MNKNDLRTCCVCHREYSFCPVCNSEDRLKPTWYFAYCSENCKDIYDVTSSFEDGRLSHTEAKTKLEKLDLSKRDSFGKSYQKSIVSIMNTKSQTIKHENKNITVAPIKKQCHKSKKTESNVMNEVIK